MARLREAARERRRAGPIDLEASNQGIWDAPAFATTDEEKIRGHGEEMVNRVQLQRFHKGLVPINPNQPPVVLALTSLGSIVWTIFPAADDLNSTIKCGVPTEKSGWNLFQFQFRQGVLHDHGHLANLIKTTLRETVEDIAVNDLLGKKEAPMMKILVRGGSKLNNSITLSFFDLPNHHSNMMFLPEEFVGQSIDDFCKKVVVGRHPGCVSPITLGHHHKGDHAI